MIKSILVPLQGNDADTAALAAATSVARSFDAHLEGLHIQPDPRLLIAGTTAGMETGIGSSVFPAELWNVIVDADRRRAKQARENFETFCKKAGIATTPGTTGLGATFKLIEGDGARDITASARYNDLVVFAHDDLSGEVFWDVKSHVIVGCGRPVLLAPAKAQFSSISNVAIAWKDTAESARALTAAMPVLAKAKSIVVLSAREGSAKVEDVLRSAEHVAALLRRHGSAARAEHVPAENKGVPESVMDRALALRSDLFVMGGYGHGRVREFVLGGFTRHVLSAARLPVLLAH